MLRKLSIHDLYPLALAEGEGVGTAYEYFAKRLLLDDWLADGQLTPRVLVAGLPQTYGASLDFLLLARELGGRITVIDDRPAALARLRQALAATAGSHSGLPDAPQLLLTANLGQLAELRPGFDLALSSEVLQRLPDGDHAAYISRLVTLAPQVALFAPNADNDAHVGRSGLAGLRLGQLERRVGQGLQVGRGTAVVTCLRTGYVDMPPFPPGITRSASERERAESGRFEAAAMWGLGLFARLEKVLPVPLRRKQSHIVYALLRLSPR